jgi:hypothetical protein
MMGERNAGGAGPPDQPGGVLYGGTSRLDRLVKRTYNRVTRLDGPGGFVTGNRLAALAHRALIGVAVKEQGIILLRRMPSG